MPAGTIQEFTGARYNDPYQEQLLREAQKRNQKSIEQLDFDHAEAGTVKIFNVSPFHQTALQGGLGSFFVPACQPDMPYSDPLEILKMTPEGKNDDMQKMSLRIVDGFAIAESIVGYGKHSNAPASLLRYGIFTCGAYVTFEFPDKKRETVQASERKLYTSRYRREGIKLIELNLRKVTPIAIKAAKRRGDRRSEQDIAEDILAANLPTEAELDAANTALRTYALERVTVADEHYRAGRPAEINSLMRWAAEFTGNDDKEWLKNLVVKPKCHICKMALEPGAALCGQCKSIVPGMEHIIIEACTPGFERLWDPSHPAYKTNERRREDEARKPEAQAEKQLDKTAKNHPKQSEV